MFFLKLPGYSFTTSWPEIGTIWTLPNPHRGWSRSLSSAYNSSFCSSPEDDWPMAQGLLPMWSRKKFGGPDTPQRHMTYLAEASPWMTWCRGWCPMKKTQVAPIWWGSTRDEFKFPVCLWTLDYVQLQSMQFYIWICVQNQNTQKLMRTHENSWYQTIPTLTHKISPWQENGPKSYYKHQAEVRRYKLWHFSNFRILHQSKSGSSDLHVNPLTRPGVSEPDSSSLCETCGIPQGKSWLISGWFPSKAI